MMATDNYRDANLRPTPFCHNDARRLHQALVEYCDYGEHDTLLELLTPETNVTPGQLLEKIARTVQGASKGDTVLFFYAGHGTFDQNSNEAFLILPNTDPGNLANTAVSLRDISKELRQQDMTCVRIFDACHSGLDVRSLSAPKAREFVDEITSENVSGWITLAACRSDQYSYPYPQREQGIFTFALCEAIKEHAENTSILPETLKIEVCRKVEQICRELSLIQVPVMNGSIAGNAPIANRRKPTRQLPGQADVKASDVIAELSEARRNAPKAATMTERNDRLSLSIKRVRHTLDKFTGEFSVFGTNVNVEGPSTANNLNRDVHPQVVDFVERFQLAPRHEIRKTVKEKRRRSTIDALLMLEPEVTTLTNYFIAQDYSLPESVVTVDVLPDDFVPLLHVYFYLIPLQMRACLLSGIACKGVASPTEQNLDIKARDHVYLDYGDDDFDRIDRFVAETVDRFKKHANASIEHRLRIIRREQTL